MKGVLVRELTLTAMLFCTAIGLLPGPASAQGEPSYINCPLGFAVIFPSPPTIRDATHTASTGASVPARQFSLDEGGTSMRITVVMFPSGPAVDEKEIDFAANALRMRGEVRFQGAGPYDPGMPGRQLNIFERNDRQLRASVYMVDHKLYITEAVAAPGNFAALQFEQSITLIDAMGNDRDRPNDGGIRRFTCG
jgi:hypothetical protein